MDLEDGVAYLTRNASVETARRWHEEVAAAVAQVEGKPDLGRRRHDLNPPDIRTLRLRRYPRYLLFYRWTTDILEILRIKHGMMDLPSLFAAESPAPEERD